MFPGNVPTMAIKETLYKIAEHTLKIPCIINQHDVYLHMKHGVTPVNHNITTLEDVFILSSYLFSLFYIAGILQLIEHQLVKFTSLLVFVPNNRYKINTNTSLLYCGKVSDLIEYNV